MQYLAVVNWERYQHYKDRSPPWIKLHRELLTSRTWVKSDNKTRVLAVACMLLAAATDNRIPYDAEHIQRVAYLNELPNIEALIKVGFVEIIDETGTALAHASNLLQNACSETETETETEKNKICSVDEEFAVWYAAYPRKHGRGQAIKAYRQARKKADASVLLAGIERYKKLKPAYADWAMPASWLRAERWLDQPDSSGNGTAPALNGDALWRWRVDGFVKRKFWKPDWGASPGNGCSAPASILQEFGLQA